MYLFSYFSVLEKLKVHVVLQFPFLTQVYVEETFSWELHVLFNSDPFDS